MQQLSVTINEHNLQCICLTIFVVANPCAVIMDPSLGNPDLKRTLLLNQNKGLDSDSTALQGVKKVPDPKQNYIGLMTEG